MSSFSFTYILKEDDIELAEIEGEIEVDDQGEMHIQIYGLADYKNLIDAPKGLAKKIEAWVLSDPEMSRHYFITKSETWDERYEADRITAVELRGTP